MSSIYGDSIFESNDMIIDRLFESINNDMVLFGESGVILESAVKDWIGKAITKIKQIIEKIKQLIKDVISKITSKVNKEKIEENLTNKELPFNFGYINPSKCDKLISWIDDYERKIRNSNFREIDDLDEFLEICHRHEYDIEKMYSDEKGRSLNIFGNIIINVPINTEDDRQRAINRFDKDSKTYSEIVQDSNSSIGYLEKEINIIQHTVDKEKDYNGSDDSNKLLKFYKAKLSMTMTCLKYYKDLVFTIQKLILSPDKIIVDAN